MDAVLQFFTDMPLEYLIGAGALLVVIVALIITALARRRGFLRRVDRFLAIPGSPDAAGTFSNKELLRRTRLLEKYATKNGPEVVQRLRLDVLWTDRLHSNSRPADFRRVLQFGTEKGLFACFLTALNNKRLAGELRTYLEQNSDFLVLRQLALSGRGEEFSGAAAREFFLDRVDEIREMSGDPEWPSRYFATKILLHDGADRSRRALLEGFSDPHPLVRKTLATEFSGEERQPTYDLLLDLFLHDPVFEVRQAARERIRTDFRDLYTLDAKQLQPEEALHVVGLLDPEESNDLNAALDLLSGDDRELRLAAARFLTQSGTLGRLFESVDFSDMQEFDRVRGLLSNAVDVNVVGFLDAVRGNPSPPTLLIAATILQHHGPQELINEVAERVFRLQEQTTDNYRNIYSATVASISERGTEEALRALGREISRRKDTTHLLQVALAGVPHGHDAIFRDVLLDALRDPSYGARPEVRAALTRLDTPFVLATCLDIITGPRDRNPHRVRIDALLTLGELKLPYAVQDVLEHLPILPIDDAREFAKSLDEFQPAEMERKVRMLLGSVDGNIRASVIAALPATGKKTFLPEIKEALTDADPDVRIAAAWSLVDYEETKALGNAVDMLRDPVERVRTSVAKAIATAGGAAALSSLRALLEDDNEVDVVKRAAVEGLQSSDQAEAVDLLVGVLAQEGPLQNDAELALARVRSTKSVRRLIEQFKDAEPQLRDQITLVFKTMGQIGEDVIREVLEEDIASLRPYLADILDHTGYVESRIRMLSHRDPAIRRRAASFLSLVGSQPAFRGIVMAARDPDADVRVQVTKALEQLETEAGSEILSALQNDPDRRIRKYTHWAIERLRAKSL